MQFSFSLCCTQGRRRTGSLDRRAAVTSASSKLNHLYGVKAWRSWVQQRNTRPPEREPVISSHTSNSVLFYVACVLHRLLVQRMECVWKKTSFSVTLLSWALLCPASSKKWGGQMESPTARTASSTSVWPYSRSTQAQMLLLFLLSLCLSRWLFPCARLFGQFLFTKGRIENIFTDKLYSQFASEISGMLQPWKPKLLPSGMISDHWLHHEEEVVIVTSSLSIEISIVVCCFRFFSPLTRWYF